MDARSCRTVVVCELVGAADLDVVDALARLQLVARRSGMRCEVQVAGEQLCGLLDLTGLAQALLQPVGQPEPREQPGRVEEVVQVDDPSA